MLRYLPLNRASVGVGIRSDSRVEQRYSRMSIPITMFQAPARTSYRCCWSRALLISGWLLPGERKRAAQHAAIPSRTNSFASYRKKRKKELFGKNGEVEHLRRSSDTLRTVNRHKSVPLWLLGASLRNPWVG